MGYTYYNIQCTILCIQLNIRSRKIENHYNSYKILAMYGSKAGIVTFYRNSWTIRNNNIPCYTQIQIVYISNIHTSTK